MKLKNLMRKAAPAAFAEVFSIFIKKILKRRTNSGRLN